MKTNSRILAVLLALALLLGLMAACGTQTTSSGDSSPETASVQSEASEAPETPTETTAEAPPASENETSAQDISTVESASPTTWPENPLGNVELPLTDDPVTVTMWMGVNPNVLKITEDIGNDCALWNELATRTGVNMVFTIVNPDT